MITVRGVATALLVSAALVSSAITGTARVAQATTGPSRNLPPTYKVGDKLARQFVGQYTLKSVPPAARIRSAAMGIEVNDQGFLYGISQFYGYDQSGSQSSWIATLYHFHRTGKTQMAIDLLSPAGQGLLLGRLIVFPPQHAALSGKIEISGRTYPIVFRQISTR